MSIQWHIFEMTIKLLRKLCKAQHKLNSIIYTNKAVMSDVSCSFICWINKKVYFQANKTKIIIICFLVLIRCLKFLWFVFMLVSKLESSKAYN